MLALRGVSTDRFDADAFVARVTTDPNRPCAVRQHEVLIAQPSEIAAGGFRGMLTPPHADGRVGPNALRLPPTLDYLAAGDILSIDPRCGSIKVLYRRSSDHNTLILTERCNNDCIMCCQPPKKAADSHLIAEALQAIKLADEGTRTLTISGGEPSLDLDGLLNVVRAARNYLPDTALHVLTNARAFRYLGNAQRLASLRHNDLMLGIPLNADLPELHDYIVQVKGAFDETVLGLMNLKRCGVRVEVRLLVQGANAHRLPETARFIARNLAFADHVAVMGLEMHGRARAHRELVWIDPLDYRDALADAVTFLAQRGISVSIYNTPLCVLDQRVWLYACRSISDWKREYPAVCAPCLQKRDCGGVFATSDDIISAGVRPIT